MNSDAVGATSREGRDSLRETAGFLAARANRLVSQVKGGLYGTVIGAAILVALLWWEVQHWKLLLWSAIFLGIQIPRFVLLSRFGRSSDSGETAVSWSRLYAILSGLCALVWGLTALFLFPADSVLHQLLLGLFLAGVAVSTTAAHSPMPECYVPSILLIMGPFCLRFLLSGDLIRTTVGIAGIVLVAALLGTATGMHNALMDSIESGLEKSGLLKRLQEEKRKTERILGDLRRERARLRRVETALKKTRDQVESKTAQRTAELKAANEKLRSRIARMEPELGELRQWERRCRDVVENSNLGIAVVQEGVFRYVNPRGAELMGRSQEQLTSISFTEPVHPDDRAGVVERQACLIRGDSLPCEDSFRVVDREGKLRWVESNSLVIEWDGRPATLSFLSDITSQRRMEQELLDVRKLRSPGTLSGEMTGEGVDALEATVGEARDPAGPQPHDTIDLGEQESPSEAEEKMEDVRSPTPSGPHVDLEISTAEDLWEVGGEEGRIAGIIDELSAAAEMEGEIRKLQVAVENVELDESGELPLPSGRYVRVSVRDADPAGETEPGGGAGLDTLRSRMENQGGVITMDSRENGDDALHIYLPATEGEGEEKAEPSTTGDPHRTRILLMDDEVGIRETFSELLTVMGYQVEVSEDGDAAVEMYRAAQEASNPFDVVILDLTVPGGTGGEEAIKKLRMLNPDVKAIVSSGHSNGDVISRYKEYGFNDIVLKPYTMNQLKETLARVLGDSGE